MTKKQDRLTKLNDLMGVERESVKTDDGSSFGGGGFKGSAIEDQEWAEAEEMIAEAMTLIEERLRKHSFGPRTSWRAMNEYCPNLRLWLTDLDARWVQRRLSAQLDDDIWWVYDAAFDTMESVIIEHAHKSRAAKANTKKTTGQPPTPKAKQLVIPALRISAIRMDLPEPPTTLWDMVTNWTKAAEAEEDEDE